MQMQGISPQWLARETLRRLDDRMDLTTPWWTAFRSIVAQNRQAQPHREIPTLSRRPKGTTAQQTARRPLVGPPDVAHRWVRSLRLH